jgi:hypothetical protein
MRSALNIWKCHQNTVVDVITHHQLSASISPQFLRKFNEDKRVILRRYVAGTCMKRCEEIKCNVENFCENGATAHGR